VFRQLADSHAGLLFEGYQRSCNPIIDRLHRVFLPRVGDPLGPHRLRDFSEAYTGTIHDMASCGVAAMHTGIPLWNMEDKSRLIAQIFKTRDTTKRLPFLMNVSQSAGLLLTCRPQIQPQIQLPDQHVTICGCVT
jgi:hypothetical protein